MNGSQIYLSDLRHKMEVQRGCKLTKHEKKAFLKVIMGNVM
jgi:hypothetical protein